MIHAPRPLALLGLLAALACTDDGPRITQTDYEVSVAGRKVADAHEVVRVTALGGEQVQRSLRLVDAANDVVLEAASLDVQGFATAASYRREGKRGKRYVELKDEGGQRVVFSRGDDERLLLPALPVVLWSAAHRVKPTAASPSVAAPPPLREVVLLDLENATFLPATVDAQGKVTPRAPPGAGAADAVRADQRGPAPFLESATPKVASWCKSQAATGLPAAEAARLIALAAKPKLSDERGGGPPSALMAVQIGGGDQAGAALVAACLRAVGHPSRVVSGAVAGKPRTWAQVHDGAGGQGGAGTWLDVDPLDMDLQGKGALAHDAVVEGFPGPLTTALARSPGPP